MHMEPQSLILILIIGGVAGWLAGLVTSGSGFGILGDIVVGVIGSFVGSWLFGVLHISFFIVNRIVTEGIIAFVGAVVLLIVIGLFSPRYRGRGGWR